MKRNHIEPIRGFAYDAMNNCRMELTSPDSEIAAALKYSKGVTAATLDSYSMPGFNQIGKLKQKLRDTRNTRQQVDAAVKPLISTILASDLDDLRPPQLLPTVLKGQMPNPAQLRKPRI